MDLRTAHDGPAAGRCRIGDEIVLLHEPCLLADLALVLPHGAYDIQRLPAEPLPELSRTHGVQRNLAKILLCSICGFGHVLVLGPLGLLGLAIDVLRRFCAGYLGRHNVGLTERHGGFRRGFGGPGRVRGTYAPAPPSEHRLGALGASGLMLRLECRPRDRTGSSEPVSIPSIDATHAAPPDPPRTNAAHGECHARAFHEIP